MFSFEFVQTVLPGKWDRANGILSMHVFGPVKTGETAAVKFVVPSAQGPAESAWTYEVVNRNDSYWLYLTNPLTQALQRYRIDILEKNGTLRLHSPEGYDLVFQAAQ